MTPSRPTHTHHHPFKCECGNGMFVNSAGHATCPMTTRVCAVFVTCYCISLFLSFSRSFVLSFSLSHSLSLSLSLSFSVPLVCFQPPKRDGILSWEMSYRSERMSINGRQLLSRRKDDCTGRESNRRTSLLLTNNTLIYSDVFIQFQFNYFHFNKPLKRNSVSLS